MGRRQEIGETNNKQSELKLMGDEPTHWGSAYTVDIVARMLEQHAISAVLAEDR